MGINTSSPSAPGAHIFFGEHVTPGDQYKLSVRSGDANFFSAKMSPLWIHISSPSATGAQTVCIFCDNVTFRICLFVCLTEFLCIVFFYPTLNRHVLNRHLTTTNMSCMYLEMRSCPLYTPYGSK